MLYTCNELELLRAANAISSQYGGTWLGNVGGLYAWRDDEGEISVGTGSTYRNQWLISVELSEQNAAWEPAAIPDGQHQWEIRCGFCQTNITRAPDGGWSLTIPAELLALAHEPDAVLALFQCMLGKIDERQAKLDRWLQNNRQWREQQQTYLLDMNALIRQAGLSYAHEHNLLPR